MKKVICAFLMVPIVLSLVYWAIHFGAGIKSGDIEVLGWIIEHKVLLTFIGCFTLLSFVGPFKKD